MTINSVKSTATALQGSSPAANLKRTESVAASEPVKTDVSVEPVVKQNEATPVTQQDTEAVKKIIDSMNTLSDSTAVFAYHEDTHRIVIKIVDKETNEVIKEFPPEKMLDMIAKTWELLGLMVDERR